MYLQKVHVLTGEALLVNFLSFAPWKSASEAATGNIVSVERSFLVYQGLTWEPHEQNLAVCSVSLNLFPICCAVIKADLNK